MDNGGMKSKTQILENEFEAFFYNSPVVKIILDSERKIHYINMIGQKLTGKSEAILAGVRAGEALRCIHSADDHRGCGFGPACQNCDMRRIINETFEQQLSHYRDQVTLSLDGDKNSSQMTFYVSSIPLEINTDNLVLITLEDITDLKNTQERLEQSEESAHLIIDTAFAAIVLSENDKVVYANKRFSQVFGHDENVTDDLPLSKLFPPEDWITLKAEIEKGVDYHGDHSGIKGDGTPLKLEIRTRPFRYQGRQVQLTFMLDITQRKAVEDELRRRDAINSLAQYAVRLGTWEWDLPDGTFHWSEQAAAIFGLTPQELGRMYEGALEMVLPQDRKQIANALQKAAQQQKDYHEIFRVLWPDGSVHWVESIGTIVPASGGKSNRMIGAIQDITEHKSKEESLKRDLALTQALARLSNMLISPRSSFKQLADMIIKYAQLITDSEHAFVQTRDPVSGNMIGHAATEMFAQGCTVEEQSGGIVFPVGVNGQYPSLWGYVLNHHQGFFTNDPANHPAAQGIPKGHIKLKNYLAVPAFMGNELMGQVAVANSKRDYTEDDLSAITRLAELMALATSRERNETILHKRTLELEEATRELKNSNADLEQFAYAASHDLQEPLRMISNFLQLLERRFGASLEGDARTFIDFAVDGAKRMQDLINDLLEFSRIGSRGKSFLPTDMNEVMEDVLKNMKLAIEQNDAIITYDPLPSIRADRSQMVQILQNLLSNAIKFRGKDAPVIHITNKILNGMTIFSVKDNGIGIAAEHKERIFGVFQRLHTREHYPGTGIGLAICERIVSRHGGKIWVESEEGKGSTFFFSIPSQLKVENG
jgi:PAS domain S-box-containing protein